MASSLQKAATQGNYGQGTSSGALSRRPRGVLYTGRPGDSIEMSDRYYLVDKNGSFRFQGKK